MEYVFKVEDLSLLDEFPNHPYQVRIDEDLRNLQNSISERGVDQQLLLVHHEYPLVHKPSFFDVQK